VEGHAMRTPNRVGYVVKRYPRYSETFIVNEILAHEAAGLEVEIFALRPPVDTHFQDAIARVRAPVSYLPRAGARPRDLWQAMRSLRDEPERLMAGLEAGWDDDGADVHQALELAKAVRARGIRHLHAHFGSSPATVARLAAFFTGITYSFTAHAKDIFHEDVDFEALKQKLRDAFSVVTVSDFNIRYLSNLEPAAAANLVRIYNGMHLDSFQLADPKERTQRILAIGRLVEKKGFGDLVDACGLLKAAGRPIECRIVGAGTAEDEDKIRRRIVDQGLEDCIEMTGPLPQEEVRREFASAGLFAAPCVVGEDGNRDGLPTTLLEAMAIGTPCISTDVTGIPEVIKDGDTGLVVPQHDPERLAAAIGRLLDDGSLRVRLAQGARKLIEQDFDIHSNTARQRAIFSEAIALGQREST
jgi:colanic acid/amylovoran biosynthesis glycosyltransferase